MSHPTDPIFLRALAQDVRGASDVVLDGEVLPMPPELGLLAAEALESAASRIEALERSAGTVPARPVAERFAVMLRERLAVWRGTRGLDGAAIPPLITFMEMRDDALLDVLQELRDQDRAGHT